MPWISIKGTRYDFGFDLPKQPADQLWPKLVVGELRYPHTSMEQPRGAQQMLQTLQFLTALGVQLG
ncbi:hypothetical protein KR52_08555 [Synechococcus sp. KORDI-52]|nr:hypothetical protein KR52_08555 [Synechococcus sp. KORDI-52]